MNTFEWIIVLLLGVAPLAAVGTTVVAVAFTARWLVPGMSWPVAIALGAIVAPPDAAAATAVMRQVKQSTKCLVNHYDVAR